MRKIERIHKICEKLEKLWSEMPDQRLGQLLENYIFDSRENRGPATCFLFHQQDDKTEKILDKLLKNDKK